MRTLLSYVIFFDNGLHKSRGSAHLVKTVSQLLEVFFFMTDYSVERRRRLTVEDVDIDLGVLEDLVP